MDKGNQIPTRTGTGWGSPAPSIDGSGGLSRRGFVQAGAGFMSLAVTGGLLGACGSDSDESSTAGETGSTPAKDVTFGFSNPYGEIPVIATVKDLVRASAEKQGWKVLLDETTGGKLQNQQSTLETWITQKVSAICLYANEPSAFEAMARRAEAAGIIWTTYANPMKAGAGGVRFPLALSGEITGRATVEWINANDPEAEVLILESDLGGELKKRTDIAMDMIKTQTKAKIVAVQVGYEQVKGLQVTEDVLQQHPNLSVVVALNDDAGLGAAEAFRKAGKKDPSKVWIVGADGTEDALTALKKGNTFFRASAALDLPKVGETVVSVTKRAIDKGWKPGDKQEQVELAPSMIKVGDSQLIDRFLATFQ